MSKRLAIFLFLALAASGCTRTRVVSTRYVIAASEDGGSCPYQWQQGDYWEFLAWALMDDPSSGEAMAITAGYAPLTLPEPGTVIRLPLDPELEEAVVTRMEAARLCVAATEARESDRDLCYDLLEEATDRDPSWSVPATNLTVLLIEDGRTEEALELLEPFSHRSTPAMVLAGIAWNMGDTETALRHLSEALATPEPDPEVLAAAGVAWFITGESDRAAGVLRRLLADPEAPSELRLRAMELAILLGDRQEP